MSGETFTCEGAIGKIVDIHEETERMRQLEEMVNLDPLTGLLNHNAASRRISTLLEAGDKHYALVLLDLDNFKAANDWHGHLFGDQVLKHVASGIQRCTLKGEIASRLGDEFMVFMEYQHKDLVGPRVEKLFRQLGDRYKGFEVQVSMGVAFSDACHGEFETLFHMADTAMYSVKNGGKNGYAFYDPALDGALSATE
jgi:putative two-component system response regulator